MRQIENKKQGMTLVEVMVFMTLTFFVMAGSFPLISHLRRSDAAHEDRLAAFTLLQTSAEELWQTSFDSLTNGFALSANGNSYERKTEKGFARGGSGDETVILVPLHHAKLGDYYQADLDFKWTSVVSEKELKSSISILLMRDL